MLAKDLLEGAVVAEQVHAEAVDERLVCLVEDGLAEGLAHALCHRVVKGIDALPPNMSFWFDWMAMQASDA